MTAPIKQLLNAIKALLTEGHATYNPPVLFPETGEIRVYRGDVDCQLEAPFCHISQIGPAKERHEANSGLWEIPVSARMVILSKDDNQTAEEHDTILDDYATDLEGVLSHILYNDPDDHPAGSNLPQERLSTTEVQVWDVYDVQVEQDVEDSGDLVIEVKFTCFCGYSTAQA